MDIHSVKAKYEEQLMRYCPMSTGLASEKREEGDQSLCDQQSARVRLQPYEIIPKQLNGYETDVEEIGVVTAQT